MIRMAFVFFVSVLLGGCGATLEGEDDSNNEANDPSQMALECTSSPSELGETTYVDVVLTPVEDGHAVSMTARELAPERPEAELEGLPADGTTTLQMGDDRSDIQVDYEGWRLVMTELEDVRGAWVGTLTFSDGTETSAACWAESVEPRFKYQSSTGKCVGEDGAEGLNAGYNPALTRGQDQAQCADLSGLELYENATTYWVNGDTDFRGADLSDAVISFSHIKNARFEGTDLGEFVFGYAEIEGQIDEHTVLPESSDNTCEIDGDNLFCRQ